MGDGSHKAISKVRVGDRVQARDPQTGQRVAKPVVALFVHPDVLVKLRIGKQVLTTTVDHRFWNSDEGRYQRADRLAKGDRVLGTDGRLLPVKGIRAASGRVGTAYNFEVADIHTYQVGPQGILVHNDCTPPTGSSASAANTVKPGYGVTGTPKRVEGPWTVNDLKQGAFGRPPRKLGRPDLHHADQMPGSGIHEVPPGLHRGNSSLHPNKWNQGVTDQMRMQDRQLHWWYRSQEMGGRDILGPGYYYDNWP